MFSQTGQKLETYDSFDQPSLTTIFLVIKVVLVKWVILFENFTLTVKDPILWLMRHENLNFRYEFKFLFFVTWQTIGQAYEDMQTQNQHLLQQVTARDDYHIKVIFYLFINVVCLFAFPL